jgi:hypothetical protein
MKKFNHLKIKFVKRKYIVKFQKRKNKKQKLLQFVIKFFLSNKDAFLL